MFKSELVLEAMENKPDFWVVKAPLVWNEIPGSPSFANITVPVGFTTDLASVPKIIRNIFDVDGRSRAPAVLHDWLYAVQRTTKTDADEFLRLALIATGEKPWVARTYWLGVHLGGASAWAGHTKNGIEVTFDSPASYTAWKNAGGKW
jgi:hypothetical protein